MDVKPQMTFRNVSDSSSVRELIERHVDRLDRFFPRLSGCRIVIERPHHHHRRGNPFQVRLDLSLGGRKIVVTRAPGNEDLYATVHDVFHAAQRRMRDHVHGRRDRRHVRVPLTV